MLINLATTLLLYHLQKETRSDVHVIFHHWFSSTGSLHYMIKDKVTEDPYFQMAICCTPFNILRESHMLPGQMNLLKYRKSLGDNLRMFLHVTPEIWSIQVPFFAFAYKHQFFSHLHFSPHRRVFQKRQRFQLKFPLKHS